VSYPYQTVDHDASISAERHPADVGVVLLQVDVGERVHIDLELDVDNARGLLDSLRRAIAESEDES